MAKKSDGKFSDATVLKIKARDRDMCAWCGGGIYGVRGQDWSVHHRKPRGMGGTSDPLISGAANGILAHGHGTQGCHAEIESKRVEALYLGFLVPRNGIQTPTSVPIKHAVHGWVVLDDDGGYEAMPGGIPF